MARKARRGLWIVLAVLAVLAVVAIVAVGVLGKEVRYTDDTVEIPLVPPAGSS